MARSAATPRASPSRRTPTSRSACFRRTCSVSFHDSQPTRCGQIEALLGAKTGSTGLGALVKELALKGTLHGLRHGFRCYGKTLRLAYFQPNFGMTPDTRARNNGALPRSWATRADLPCAQTPAASRHQVLTIPRLLPFRCCDYVGSADIHDAALSHRLHAPGVRCAGGIAPAPRNTRSRGWPFLNGSGLAPGGSQKGVSDALVLSLSSSPSRLCLAQRNDDRGRSRQFRAQNLASGARTRGNCVQ